MDIVGRMGRMQYNQGSDSNRGEGLKREEEVPSIRGRRIWNKGEGGKSKIEHEIKLQKKSRAK